MIASRIDLEVKMENMAEALEFQKSLFREGGPYHGQVKGHRIYQAYFSGQRNIVSVEVHYDSLGEFEAGHLKGLPDIPPEFWAKYHDLFDSKAHWTHWRIEDAS